jgi:hypothetical protein
VLDDDHHHCIAPRRGPPPRRAGPCLAELHTRGVTDRDHGLRTGPWLARETHLPIPAASARVKAAVVLSTWFPHVLAALAAGRISWDHATVIARAANPRIAAQLAEHQTALIDAADRTVFARWRLEVIGLADQLDQDGGHDPSRDHARNRLSVNPTFDGLAHLNGLLTAELGPIVIHAIEVRAELLLQRHLADHKIDPPPILPRRAPRHASSRSAASPAPPGRTTNWDDDLDDLEDDSETTTKTRHLEDDFDDFEDDLEDDGRTPTTSGRTSKTTTSPLRTTD